MARCLHVNKVTGELLLHMVYFSKYQILQGPCFCFLCHLVFLLLIFTPPGCGYEGRALPDGLCTAVVLSPLPICSLVLWILSLKQELPSVDCVWHGGLWLYSRIRLRGCCQPVTPQPCVPWMHGWFLGHHSMLDSIWKQWISSLHGTVLVQSCGDWCEVDPGSQVGAQSVQASAVVQ